mgnify:CR=1 FL=1
MLLGVLRSSSALETFREQGAGGRRVASNSVEQRQEHFALAVRCAAEIAMSNIAAHIVERRFQGQEALREAVVSFVQLDCLAQRFDLGDALRESLLTLRSVGLWGLRFTFGF